jgi:O-6-methylguanine DNA methyltransferase
MVEGGIRTFVTLIGMISISDDGEGNIDGLYLPNHNLPVRSESQSPVIEEAIVQINDYLSGKRKDFDLPISINGTEFQIKVWNALREVPYGETATYAQIAERIGRKQSYRAVGTACENNPLPIIIPCHRAVGASGPGGYLGGFEMKKRLMTVEGIKI